MERLNIPVNSTPARVGRNLVILYLIMAENINSSPIALGRGVDPFWRMRI